MGSTRDLRLLAGATFLSSAGDLLALIVLALHGHELTVAAWPSRRCLRPRSCPRRDRAAGRARLRTLITARVPDAVHGRTFAAYNAARNTAELVAVGAGGPLDNALGPRAAPMPAGLEPLMAAAAGLTALRERPLRVADASAPASVASTVSQSPYTRENHRRH